MKNQIYAGEILHKLIAAKEMITSMFEQNDGPDRQEVNSRGNNNIINVSGRDIIRSHDRTAHGEKNVTIRPSKGPKDGVFIVHGRDDLAKDAVARFIEKLGHEAIILHEQPNEGRAIIEKFEYYSSTTKYAVILLTPDDVGGLAFDQSNLSTRARQNVIFEMGFFFGKLGRSNVCALYQGIELPSDLQGILYIPLDRNGVWKELLRKELEKAGLKSM